MPAADPLLLKANQEYHPWVSIDTPRITQPKIILGSFPIWSLTRHELDPNEQSHFVSIRIKKTGEFPFFYGSAVNRFWLWYQTYLDVHIELLNKDSILSSLQANQIGITDAILSCTRKEKSALDKDLSKRLYNHRFFTYPQTGEVKKILCTSKGVMNEMLLHNILSISGSICEKHLGRSAIDYQTNFHTACSGKWWNNSMLGITVTGQSLQKINRFRTP